MIKIKAKYTNRMKNYLLEQKIHPNRAWNCRNTTACKTELDILSDGRCNTRILNEFPEVLPVN